LSPGELDPLNRRLVAEPKPDIVVQGWYHTGVGCNLRHMLNVILFVYDIFIVLSD